MSDTDSFCFESFSIPSYIVPRTVIDTWILGANPRLKFKEIQVQNLKDHSRMKIRDWRNQSNKLYDKQLRLQFTLYSNQIIFSLVYSYLLKHLKQFMKDNAAINEYHLVQSPTPLTADFLNNGQLIMMKDFQVYIREKDELKLLPMAVQSFVKINDSHVHFKYEKELIL